MSALTSAVLSKRRCAASVTGLALVLSTALLATPAEAANKSFSMDCHDRTNSFQAHVTLTGSGAPKAKYDVSIMLIDKIDDARAPKVHLISANQDSSRTIYPWHFGGQGRNVVTHLSTTLQQPKGLKLLIMEATSEESAGDMFFCSDYGPK